VTNEDSTPHTFTLEDESVDLELAGGESGTATIDVSESTGLFCRIHPNMTGMVEVA
jgi:plastocyanin